MMEGDTIITIDGKLYVIDRTFDGLPAIYHNRHVIALHLTNDQAVFPEHIDDCSPQPEDQLVILCHAAQRTIEPEAQ